MRSKWQLRGPDYLMLGFDHELRRRGFAGNSCQIILNLDGAVSPPRLQARLDQLWERYPILGARPGGLVWPRWKAPRRRAPAPRVRVHRAEPALRERLFNQPLALRRGELARFDLVEGDGRRTDLVFTWAHALMDAPGAEHFLAVTGREDLPLPDTERGARNGSVCAFRLRERCRLAWRYLHHLDALCRAAPRSIGTRHRAAPRQLRYRVETFTAEETRRVRARAADCGGVLGQARFHAAAALVELHHLHRRLGVSSPSYVLPLPVGLRLKGSIEPLFGNPVTMLMLQFLPEHLGSVAGAAAAFKRQLEQAMRAGLAESGRELGELFRFLPLPVYMALLKQGLRGEIGSLFYGDTGAVSPLLTEFLGAPVLDFTHAAAVTPSPGVGTIFYHFRDELRVTVLHALPVLSEPEAADFAARLRARLLEP